MNKMNEELYGVKTKLAEMSVCVSRMYENAVKAMRLHDIELAENVVKEDSVVDRLDLEIDEKCLRILALYDPKAMELRYVVAVLRIIIDLERVGDHCKVMARQLKKYYCAPLIAKLEKFDEIAILSNKMLNDSCDIFFKRDASKFIDIIKTDKLIGDLQKQLNQSLVELISEDSGNTNTVISLINVVRRMERIADHAKNIAELVPYVETGEIMRHKRIADETVITD